jgi:hypothetical protein
VTLAEARICVSGADTNVLRLKNICVSGELGRGNCFQNGNSSTGRRPPCGACNIPLYIREVFADGELEHASVVAKKATTAADGKT